MFSPKMTTRCLIFVAVGNCAAGSVLGLPESDGDGDPGGPASPGGPGGPASPGGPGGPASPAGPGGPAAPLDPQPTNAEPAQRVAIERHNAGLRPRISRMGNLG